MTVPSARQHAVVYSHTGLPVPSPARVALAGGGTRACTGAHGLREKEEKKNDTQKNGGSVLQIRQQISIRFWRVSEWLILIAALGGGCIFSGKVLDNFIIKWFWKHLVFSERQTLVSMVAQNFQSILYHPVQFFHYRWNIPWRGEAQSPAWTCGVESMMEGRLRIQCHPTSFYMDQCVPLTEGSKLWWGLTIWQSFPS